MKKYLIITIDTEGDNLWNWKSGDAISTENVLSLPRFQALCDEYGFLPTWLSNYEMLSDSRYVDFISRVVDDGRGELGMHLHAWNTPPYYDLPKVVEAAPYLIEYPTGVMEEKIATITELIESRTGIKPLSHRAGRWAMDDRYFSLLKKHNYTVDCSVTPHINWGKCVGQSGCPGPDYSGFQELPYIDKSGIVEVPMTTRNNHSFIFPDSISPKSICKSAYKAFKGSELWLRPSISSLNEMKRLMNIVNKQQCDYVMLMLHSSEMIPGCSPYVNDREKCEKMYNNIRQLFEFLGDDFKGITLKNYANEITKKGVLSHG